MSRKKIPSIQGDTFLEILQELHQGVFKRLPDETNPFHVSELYREYVAYLLALYYDCNICESFHERQIQLLHRAGNQVSWNWKKKIKRAVLFLQTERRHVPRSLWSEWVDSWTEYIKPIEKRRPNLAHQFTLAIGIARKDKALMKIGVESLMESTQDKELVRNMVRDIDRVVVFMKAATSKNRTDTYLLKLLEQYEE